MMMARNVEIKARIRDVAELVDKATAISTSESVIIEQEDVFYQMSSGRLKLRNEKGLTSFLIYYERPDVDGPKLCEYDKCPINENDVPGLKRVLGKALGEKGLVRKRRQLFMVDQTRVHIDDVEGLGQFMELEVALSENQSLEDGQKLAESLMDELCVQKDDLLSGAYFDLLAKK